MADVNSNTLVDGGEFVTESAALGGSIPASSSGNILVITPPAGQRVVLIGLVPGSTAPILDLTITFGTRNVIDSGRLSASPAPNATVKLFAIGQANFDQTASVSYQSSGYIDKLTGNIDEIMTISTPTPTAAIVWYNYQFGV